MISTTNTSGSQDGYKFGVFHYLPTNRTNKVYTPVASKFQETLGRNRVVADNTYMKMTFAKFFIAKKMLKVENIQQFFYL